MTPEPSRIAVIVAHPDDETLWAGGTLLLFPEWEPVIVTVCRGNDPDRAPRFQRVLEQYGATGAMGNLDDGPEQAPLSPTEVQEAVLSLLSERRFDCVLTHGRNGEYTRHLRHEEVCRAVISLWGAGQLELNELWTFSYEDDDGQALPRTSDDAAIRMVLPEDVWRRKYEIITKLYGFAPDTWEARATPREEGFRIFSSSRVAREWLKS